MGAPEARLALARPALFEARHAHRVGPRCLGCGSTAAGTVVCSHTGGRLFHATRSLPQFGWTQGKVNARRAAVRAAMAGRPGQRRKRAMADEFNEFIRARSGGCEGRAREIDDDAFDCV